MADSESQRVVLVTGATNGLGRLLVGELAGRGWTVLVHGRDADKVRALVTELGEPAVPLVADLSDLSQVRGLAEQALKLTSRLDVLVNNAGVGFGVKNAGREISRDGYELRLAVNYLAPVLLTRELLPLLTASAPSRVVNVGSLGQMPIDLGDLQFEHGYGGIDAYRRSKLAMAAWTFDLAAELEGTAVTANCLHPATFMPTGMVLESGIDPVSRTEDGMAATLKLIVDPALADVTGQFFDGETVSRANAQAYDPVFRLELKAATDPLIS